MRFAFVYAGTFAQVTERDEPDATLTLQAVTASHRDYGYFAVFLSSRAKPCSCSPASPRICGYLSLPWVMATAAIAGFCGDQAAFFADGDGPRSSPGHLDSPPHSSSTKKLAASTATGRVRASVRVVLRIASPIVMARRGAAAVQLRHDAAGAIVWAIVDRRRGLPVRRSIHDHARHAKHYEQRDRTDAVALQCWRRRTCLRSAG